MDWPEEFNAYLGIQQIPGTVGLCKLKISSLVVSGDEVKFHLEIGTLESDGTGQETDWTGTVDRKNKGFKVSSKQGRKQEYEMWFSNDFSVLYSAPCFIEDWQSSLAFYWEITPASKVLTRKFPGDDETKLAMKFKKAVEFMGDDIMWHDGLQRNLTCTIGFESLSSIWTNENKFQGRVSVTYMWPVDTEEAYRFIFDERQWEPSWNPIRPKVINAAAVDSVQSTESVVVLQKFPEETDFTLQATWRFTFTGEFREVMDLPSFPFDSQLLHVGIEIPRTSARTVIRPSEVFPKLESLESSWSCLGASAGIVSDEGAVTLTCCVKRNPLLYIVRVVLILMLMCILTLTSFSLDVHADAADRMSICLTLLLTAVAYSFVISSLLPEIGYLTFLDKGVLWTLSYIGVVTLQCATMAKFVDPVDVDFALSIDFWCFTVDAVWLLVLICCMCCNIFFCMKPEENRKLEQCRGLARRTSLKAISEEAAKGESYIPLLASE